MFTIKSYVWLILALLAAFIAWYAATILVGPSDPPAFVAGLLSQHPYAAYVHFSAGAIALLTGAMQTNAALRIRFIGVHRWLGRIYLFAVIAGSLTGLELATSSSGGEIAHFGFASLAVIWFVTTLLAYRQIRRGNIRAHRRWMIRSYALTLAAVTLRLYIPASQILGISIAIAYPIIAWLCWVPNLMIAEWYARKVRAAQDLA